MIGVSDREYIAVRIDDADSEEMGRNAGQSGMDL